MQRRILQIGSIKLNVLRNPINDDGILPRLIHPDPANLRELGRHSIDIHGVDLLHYRWRKRILHPKNNTNLLSTHWSLLTARCAFENTTALSCHPERSEGPRTPRFINYRHQAFSRCSHDAYRATADSQRQTTTKNIFPPSSATKASHAANYHPNIQPIWNRLGIQHRRQF